MLPHKPNNNNYKQYLSLGAEITSSMLVPLAGGYLVDYYFGTQPWGFLVAMVIGFLAVFSVIYKIALRANKNSHKKKESDE